MALFGFFKSYTRDDLQAKISVIQGLYRQARVGSSVKSRSDLKAELSTQFRELLEICKKGGFYGGENVEWPSDGCYTSLRNVLQDVQIFIEMM